MTLYAVILAGGSGTRLWPYSRTASPKQLLPLLDGASLLQATVRRLLSTVAPEHVLVLGHPSYLDEMRRQLPELPSTRIIGEPEALGTAAAIGLGAGMVGAEEPGATMLVLPTDHVIAPTDAFLADVSAAQEIARDGWLVTFGIRPDRPEPGYGYMVLGRWLPGRPGARQVERFVEKPDAETINSLMTSGQGVWNSGMFVWTVEAIMHALHEHLPTVGRMAEAVRSGRPADGDWMDRFLAEIYGRVTERTTIDYGVMRHSGRVACVPAQFSWLDVGSWRAVAEALAADESGNTLRGPSLAVETTGSLVFALGGRLVALLGLTDMVVVDTPDALLVCPKARAQDVRLLVESLRKSGDDRLL